MRMRFRVARWPTSHQVVTGARPGSGRVGSSGVTSHRHSRRLRDDGTSAFEPFVCGDRRRAAPDQRAGCGGHQPGLANVPPEPGTHQRHGRPPLERGQCVHVEAQMGIQDRRGRGDLGVDRRHDRLRRVVGRLRVCDQHRHRDADLEEPELGDHDRPWMQSRQHRHHVERRRGERCALRGRRGALLVRTEREHRRRPVERLHRG